jgi:predicted transcriptional regulator
MEVDLNKHEREILRVLLGNKGWLNTTEIANKSGMSWNTAIKYLEQLDENHGWVLRKKNYWKANR